MKDHLERFSVTGKKALVTGGSRGIGAAVATVLAQAGADVALEKIPLRRFGQPTEVADLVLFLASPASDLICGDTILIDGGYTAL